MVSNLIKQILLNGDFARVYHNKKCPTLLRIAKAGKDPKIVHLCVFVDNNKNKVNFQRDKVVPQNKNMSIQWCTSHLPYCGFRIRIIGLEPN